MAFPFLCPFVSVIHAPSGSSGSGSARPRRLAFPSSCLVMWTAPQLSGSVRCYSAAWSASPVWLRGAWAITGTLVSSPVSAWNSLLS